MYSAEDLYAEDDGNDLEIIQEGEAAAAENSDHNADNEDEQDGEQAKDSGAEEDGEKKTVKPKRIVRNPQPKLNAETLKGKRGLLALQDHFKDVKFKGKGHEEEDLRKIMKTYEYWCHRMFPKFSFDDCLAQLEKLGTKKTVQVHIKKIRLDMVTDDIEPPILDNSDDEDNTQQRNDDPFDDLVPRSNQSATDAAIDLTDDQLETIRLNREKAMRLRQERLKNAQAKASNTLGGCSQGRSDEFSILSQNHLSASQGPSSSHASTSHASQGIARKEPLSQNPSGSREDEFPNSDEEMSSNLVPTEFGRDDEDVDMEDILGEIEKANDTNKNLEEENGSSDEENEPLITSVREGSKNNSQDSENNRQGSGKNSRDSENKSQDPEKNSQDSKKDSQDSENNSQRSENNSQHSENNSQRSENNSQRSENSSQSSENNSQHSENNSQRSENNSQRSENSSQSSKNNNQRSENNSQRSENSSQSSKNNSQRSEKNSQRSESSTQSSQNNSQHSENSSQSSENNSQRSENNSQRLENNSQDPKNNSQDPKNNSKDSPPETSDMNEDLDCENIRGKNVEVTQLKTSIETNDRTQGDHRKKLITEGNEATEISTEPIQDSSNVTETKTLIEDSTIFKDSTKLIENPLTKSTKPESTTENPTPMNVDISIEDFEENSLLAEMECD